MPFSDMDYKNRSPFLQEASSPEEEVELAFAQLKRLLWLGETNPEAFKRELEMMYPGEERPQ